MDNTQQQIDDLKLELETLKRLFHKDNFSNLEIKTKQVQFKGGVAPIQNSSGVTTVAGLITLLKNINILK